MTIEPQERTPYIGPRPFEQRHKDLFFGRDREVSEILSLVIAHRMLLLYAQSGAGKTSLINAGLIPLLEEEGFEVLPLARVRGLIPEDIKPEEIPNLYVFNTLMSWARAGADPRLLAQMSLVDFLNEREHPIDEEELPSPRVVIFDQFEELFAFYPERWRDRADFFAQVCDALEEYPRLRVVFVMREDYIAQLDSFAPLLPEKLRTRFRMERLRERAALAAVKGPLRDTRRSLAEGVAEQLVEELLKVRVQTAAGETVEVTGEFIEPVQLQVVCQSLWQDLPPDVTVITQDHLQAFGDVDQALSGFYERSIKRAAQETGAKEGDLRTWFERALITPAGTRGTAYRGREETGGIPNAAVDVLENLHLIRGEWRAGARWYELTHDRFIEPIRESNKTWGEKRRRTLLTGIGAAMATLVGILVIAFAATLATQGAQESKVQQAVGTVTAVGQAATQDAQQSQVTVTAAAAEVSEAKATAQQSQATAAVAAAELSDAKVTVTAAAVELSKADYIRQGLVYAEQGDYDQAIAHYDQAIALDPDYVEAYLYRGLAYRKRGEYDHAIADYSKAIELVPDNAEAYYDRGCAYLGLGNYEQVMADFSKAVELNPNMARRIDCGINIDPANPGGRPSVQQIQYLGATWVRFTFKDDSDGPHPTRFAFYDDLMQELSQAGINILMTLSYETYPGKPAHDADEGTWDAYIAKFVARCGQIAEHYGSQVQAYQIWPEPDFLVPSPGYDPCVRPEVFGPLLRDAFEAIKEVSSATVVMGGLASGQPGYVEEVRASTNNVLYVDAVGVQSYGWRPTEGWPRPDWGFGVLGDLVQAYYNAAGKPIWITEVGTDDTSVQGEFPRRAFEALNEDLAEVAPYVFWFCWSDGMVPPFGLVDVAGEKKGSYTSFQQFALLPFERVSFQGADQAFEHGRMIWREDKKRIYVLYDDNTWADYEDTFNSDTDPISTGLQPPAGLQEPAFGFGKVWRGQAGVRDRLGWATEGEQAYPGAIQRFAWGQKLWAREGVYLLRDDGTWEGE